jgi:phospholipase C
VVSPISKFGGITSEEHDHTSVLRPIEEKWNLPALTHRDANANTIMDCLNPDQKPWTDNLPVLAERIPPAAHDTADSTTPA